MFRQSQTLHRRLLLGLIIAVIAAASLGGAILAVQRTDNAIRDQLKSRAASIASLLDKSDVGSLSGSANDPGYNRLKQHLADLKMANRDIRSLYIMKSSNGSVMFMVDSEDPGNRLYSPPGEVYPDATPLLQNLFVTGSSAVEGPTADEFGSWVSGLSALMDDDGNISGVFGIDIDSHSYYQALLQAASIPLLIGLLALTAVLGYERLRSRDQALLKLQSHLLSIASHELRSPLTGIRWAVENLEDAGKERPAIIKQILASVNKLQFSIEDIMSMTRLSSHKPSVADCNLSELLRDVCQTQELVAAEKHVRLDLTKVTSKAVTIQADPIGLKRALHNVVSNALKYGQTNTTVSIKLKQHDDHVRLDVSDQGIGVPASELSHVFDGFYRASNTTNIEGTGLGLYVSRQIIEDQRGTITLTSDSGGTTVSITLPR